VNAATITRQSKSNLALAFVSLGRERKRDITIFYAFCRVVDDIADSSDLSVIEKRVRLAKWRQMLRAGAPDEPLLARDLRQLMRKYSLSPNMLEEIIAGVEMDLSTVRYPTFEELRVYCHRVASAVGLVSIEVFGYRNPRCREYAIDLGLALQMTNIIRDVKEDAEMGRVYLPQEDLEKFGLEAAELIGKPDLERFRPLLEMEADRARVFYHAAEDLVPLIDEDSQAALWVLVTIYRLLLEKIATRKYDVFQRKISLTVWEKLKVLGHGFVRRLA